MKKWMCIPVAIYPYAYMIASALLSLLEYAPDNINTDDAQFVILMILVFVYHILVLAVIIYHIVQSARGAVTAKDAAVMNMIVKGVHIPAYIFHFVIGLIGLLMSVWGIGLLMWAVIIDAATIIVSGTFALGCTIRIKKENLMPTWAAVITAVGSYIFCIDVVIAVVYGVKCLIKRNEAVQVSVSS